MFDIIQTKILSEKLNFKICELKSSSGTAWFFISNGHLHPQKDLIYKRPNKEVRGKMIIPIVGVSNEDFIKIRDALQKAI